MIYRILLGIHSWNRWIILVLGLILLVTAWKKWIERSDDATQTKKLSIWFIISVDVQLLLGIVLFFVSPVIATFLQNIGASMGESAIRFWAVEHTTMMLIATVIAHVARVKVKKAADPAASNKLGAIWFSIAYVLILLTIPWPFMPWGRALFFV